MGASLDTEVRSVVVQIGQVLAHSQVLLSFEGFLVLTLLCIALLLLFNELLDLVHVLIDTRAGVGCRFDLRVVVNAVQQVVGILLAPEAGVVQSILSLYHTRRLG